MSLASIQTLLLVIQLIIALALVAVILLQRSEGGALGIGGGGQAGFLTARGAGDVLSRATAILGTLFIVNCLALALIAKADRVKPTAVDAALQSDLSKVAPVPTLPAPTPAEPSVPVAQ